MVEKPKRISGRLTRSDKKLGIKPGITKKEFFKILDKASQPIKREVESDSEKTQT